MWLPVGWRSASDERNNLNGKVDPAPAATVSRLPTPSDMAKGAPRQYDEWRSRSFRGPNAARLGQLLNDGGDGGRDPDRVAVRRHYARRGPVHGARSFCNQRLPDADLRSFGRRIVREPVRAGAVVVSVADRDHSRCVRAKRPRLSNLRHPHAAQDRFRHARLVRLDSVFGRAGARQREHDRGRDRIDCREIIRALRNRRRHNAPAVCRCLRRLGPNIVALQEPGPVRLATRPPGRLGFLAGAPRFAGPAGSIAEAPASRAPRRDRASANETLSGVALRLTLLRTQPSQVGQPRRDGISSAFSVTTGRRSLAPGSLFQLIAVRHAELALQIPEQSHQFLLVLGIRLVRPFNVSCVLKGRGGKREERWTSEEFAAGDGSRPLTELADRHSPLEVLSEKIVDPSRSAEPAIPIDDKSECRPEGDQAPNDCANLIHELFASSAIGASGRVRRLFVSRNPTRADILAGDCPSFIDVGQPLPFPRSLARRQAPVPCVTTSWKRPPQCITAGQRYKLEERPGRE